MTHIIRGHNFGNPAAGNYSGFQDDGTFRLYGAATAWDDLIGNPATMRLPASSAPEWVTWDYGIVGGVEFPVLAFGVGEYLPFTIQSPHAMRLLSALEHHIHYSTPTNDAGKIIKFQVDVIAAGVNEAFAVPTGSPFTAEHTLPATATGMHRLFSAATIPAVNTTVSTLYIGRLMRIAPDSNGYGSDVYVLFTDSHHEVDGFGSAEEYVK